MRMSDNEHKGIHHEHEGIHHRGGVSLGDRTSLQCIKSLLSPVEKPLFSCIGKHALSEIRTGAPAIKG